MTDDYPIFNKPSIFSSERVANKQFVPFKFTITIHSHQEYQELRGQMYGGELYTAFGEAYHKHND